MDQHLDVNATARLPNTPLAELSSVPPCPIFRLCFFLFRGFGFCTPASERYGTKNVYLLASTNDNILLFWIPAPVLLPLSKASLSLFNTSADVGPCFLYIANNPFTDCSLERELVIGAAALLIFPAMLILFFFGKYSSSSTKVVTNCG